MRRIIVTSASCIALLLAACSSQTTETKDLLPKMRAIQTAPVEGARLEPNFVGLTAPAPASVPVAPQSVTWKDSAGTSYSLATNYTLTYTPAPPTTPPPTSTSLGPPVIQTPSTAVNPGSLAGGPWVAQPDPGTGSGTSTGAMVYPVAGVTGGNTARQYSMTYTNMHGELFHVSFGQDPNATHFIYDTYVFFPDVTQLQNVELDMNQVVANGNTVILATQCASGSKSWEYTLSVNGGTHWVASTIPCNPLTWTPNVWHHIQIATHHDANGSVTYDWVGVDGMYSNFPTAATGNSSYALKWAAGTLLINFQLDGLNKTSGSIVAKMDSTTVYRW